MTCRVCLYSPLKLFTPIPMHQYTTIHSLVYPWGKFAHTDSSCIRYASNRQGTCMCFVYYCISCTIFIVHQCLCRSLFDPWFIYIVPYHALLSYMELKLLTVFTIFIPFTNITSKSFSCHTSSFVLHSLFWHWCGTQNDNMMSVREP